MRIDTKCSIAIHSMILIAVYGKSAKITSRIIARSTGCNDVIVRNILAKLKNKGLININRGVGGTTLNRELSSISIFDIYDAVEEKDLQNIIGIHKNPYQKCPIGQCIEDILEKPYTKIGEAIKKEMQSYTLDKIVEDFYRRKPNWKDVLHDKSMLL